MALTVKDILELPSGQKLKLLAGKRGLDRPVISVEIADYEFAADVDFLPGADFDIEDSLEPGSFIITSFLFAKDDPGLIMSAVETMEKMGMAGLAYKKVIYDDLPEEVIAFAEKKKFPIFSFGRTLWFENIIFDIMYAVQFDDRVYLSEEKIDDMLTGQMDPSEVGIIRKGISLKLQPYVSAVYVSGSGLDADRLQRNFYLQKGLHSKGLVVRYREGLFLLITSIRPDHKSHDLIRKEVFEVLGIDDADEKAPGNRESGTGVTGVTVGTGEGTPKGRGYTGRTTEDRTGRGGDDAPVKLGMSNVLTSIEIDRALRQSWLCYMASVASEENFESFGRAGIHRVLLPALENEEAVAFSQEIVEAISVSEDLMETAWEYVRAGGEIVRTAEVLHCHQNTVRYRLSRIRTMTGLEEVTDGELYLQLKAALAIHRVGDIIPTPGLP